MFDISWGEIAVISAVGIALLGRKDLPPASHTLGYHVGRIVGLLRGARVRADRYTADHSLRQLQNEFKSGLRELDAVKAELAGSMMMDSAGAGGGMMGGVIGGGGGLGASVSGVDRIRSSRGASVAARGGGGWEAATQMIDATSTLPPCRCYQYFSTIGSTITISCCCCRGGVGETWYWIPFHRRRRRHRQ
jgi:Sec-independent protein translocase protein TatA